MESDEGLYHATPQTKGKLAHEPVDTKSSNSLEPTVLLFLILVILK